MLNKKIGIPSHPSSQISQSLHTDHKIKNLITNQAKMPILRYHANSGSTPTPSPSSYNNNTNRFSQGLGSIANVRKIDRNMAYVDKLKMMLANNPRYTKPTQQTQPSLFYQSRLKVSTQQQSHRENMLTQQKQSATKTPCMKTQGRIRHERTESHLTILSEMNGSKDMKRTHGDREGSFYRSRSKGKGQICNFEGLDYILDREFGESSYGKETKRTNKEKDRDQQLLNQIKQQFTLQKKRIISTTLIQKSPNPNPNPNPNISITQTPHPQKNRNKYQIINYTKFTPYPSPPPPPPSSPSPSSLADQQREQQQIICRKWGKMQLLDLLGTGANASVRVGVCNFQYYAVKVYEKYKLIEPRKRRRVYWEIQLLGGLDPHPNLITMYQAFQDKREIHVIMQHIKNSQTLHQHFRNSMLQLQLVEIKKIFSKIVQGVSHLTKNGIAHRDIKPDNILLCWQDDCMIVKIIDFGFAVRAPYSDFHCGTPNFMAPELLEKGGRYGTFGVDVWALGVMLFYLCQGRYPFRGYDERDLFKNIKKGIYQFHKIQDSQLQKLISEMLQTDPEKRITITQLQTNEWILQE